MSSLLQLPLLFHLGAVFCHALWQLTLLGGLAWVGLVLLRRTSPQVRYAWSCAFLLAMVLFPCLTFTHLSTPDSGWATGPIAVIVRGTREISTAADWFSGLRDGFAERMSWFALAWGLGTLFMLLRFVGSMVWLQRTYLHGARAVPEALLVAFRNMAARCGLAHPPRLCLSWRADTPLVLGWWRVVVILPVSALLHLSPVSLEALLAHELAHIRRRDPLMNLLQSLAEALLFFHPATWWLSRQIRELRESCCDDDAVALTGDPRSLASGLAALELLRNHLPPDPSPALAAAKGPLMSRIHRLFRPDDLVMPDCRGLGLAALLLLSGGLLLAQGTQKAGAPAPKSTSAADAPLQTTLSQVKVLSKPAVPKYPAEAKAANIQGTVIVEILVGPDGRCVSATAIEGPEQLRKCAVDYAKAWRFKPVRQDGKPVSVQFKLTMPFKLS
jgi:TonB family protein